MSDDTLDDFMAGLDLDAKPLDANELFYHDITSGGMPKIHLMRYWLRIEMSFYWHFRHHNINFTKNVVKNGQSIHSPLTQLEYARVALKFYLQQFHLPRFNPDYTKAPCDYDKVIDLIVAYAPIREVIEAIEK